MARFSSIRRWLPGLSIALVFTVLANAETLRVMLRDGSWDHAFYSGLQDEDQARYLSEVREVLDGYPLIGSSSTKEYRIGISPVGLFNDWIAAPFFAIPGLSFAAGSTITDLLFSFAVLLLTFLWLRTLLGNTAAAAGALAIMSLTVWGMEWLIRDTTKFGLILPALYLCIVFLPERETWGQRIARGMLVGLMVLSYSYHWTVFLAFEGLLLLVALVRREAPLRTLLLRGLAVSGPFLVFALPYGLLMSRVDPQVFSETFARFGVIDTHGLAAPWLQAKLLLWTVPLLIALKVRVIQGRKSILLLILLLASLVTLNTNIVTGREADFFGHYGRVVGVFGVAAAFLLFARLASARFTTVIGTATALFVVVTWALLLGPLPSPSAAEVWKASDEAKLMDWLDRELPAESVVLAPYETANFIPIFTSHYVNTNNGTRLFFVPEQELFERYLIQTAFFPEEYEPAEIGGFAVFGLYAGQKFARERTLHQFRTFFQEPYEKTLKDFIRNRALLARYEREAANPNPTVIRAWLAAYPPDVLATRNEIPAPYRDLFENVEDLGAYHVHRYTGPR